MASGSVGEVGLTSGNLRGRPKIVGFRLGYRTPFSSQPWNTDSKTPR